MSNTNENSAVQQGFKHFSVVKLYWHTRNFWIIQLFQDTY